MRWTLRPSERAVADYISFQEIPISLVGPKQVTFQLATALPEETISNQEDFSDQVLTRENFSSDLGEFSDILSSWKANL